MNDLTTSAIFRISDHLLRVLWDLEFRDLASARGVCKHWKALIDRHLWRGALAEFRCGKVFKLPASEKVPTSLSQFIELYIRRFGHQLSAGTLSATNCWMCVDQQQTKILAGPFREHRFAMNSHLYAYIDKGVCTMHFLEKQDPGRFESVEECVGVLANEWAVMVQVGADTLCCFSPKGEAMWKQEIDNFPGFSASAICKEAFYCFAQPNTLCYLGLSCESTSGSYLLSTSHTGIIHMEASETSLFLLGRGKSCLFRFDLAKQSEENLPEVGEQIYHFSLVAEVLCLQTALKCVLMNAEDYRVLTTVSVPWEITAHSLGYYTLKVATRTSYAPSFQYAYSWKDAKTQANQKVAAEESELAQVFRKREEDKKPKEEEELALVKTLQALGKKDKKEKSPPPKKEEEVPELFVLWRKRGLGPKRG